MGCLQQEQREKGFVLYVRRSLHPTTNVKAGYPPGPPR